MLIDRGGAGGEQTFAEAAATAADAVAAVQVRATSAGAAGGGSPSRCCRCVGVVVANDRAGQEVFAMAPPRRDEQCSEPLRAPFPVVMVSQESGQLLKGALCADKKNAAAPTTTATVARQGNEVDGTNYGYCTGGEVLPHPTVLPGGGIAGGVVVSLGASKHCRTPTSIGSCLYSGTKPGGAMEPTFGVFDLAAGNDGNVGVVAGPDMGTFFNGPFYPVSWPNPVEAWWRMAYGVASTGWGVETSGWKRERMLYGAQTLPVRFEESFLL